MAPSSSPDSAQRGRTGDDGCALDRRPSPSRPGGLSGVPGRYSNRGLPHRGAYDSGRRHRLRGHPGGDRPADWMDRTPERRHVPSRATRRCRAFRVRGRPAQLEKIPIPVARTSLDGLSRRDDLHRRAGTGRAQSVRLPRHARLRARRPQDHRQSVHGRIPRPQLLPSPAAHTPDRGAVRTGRRYLLLRLDGHRTRCHERLRPLADRDPNRRSPRIPGRRGHRGGRVDSGLGPAPARDGRSGPDGRGDRGADHRFDGTVHGPERSPRPVGLEPGSSPVEPGGEALPIVHQLHDGLPDLLLPHDRRSAEPGCRADGTVAALGFLLQP